MRAALPAMHLWALTSVISLKICPKKALSIAALCTQGAVTTITATGPTKDMVACFAMFYGGLIQLLAGMWEMWKANTFAATAFSSYGGFWMGWALYGILKSVRTKGLIFECNRPPLESTECLLLLQSVLPSIICRTKAGTRPAPSKWTGHASVRVGPVSDL